MAAPDERDHEPREKPTHARLYLSVFVTVLLGCGGSSAGPCRFLRADAPPLPTQSAAHVRWVPERAPAYPALDARLAGHGAWLILDTGANQHALEHGAGFWLGLPTRGRVRATDAVGVDVRLADYGEVRVALGMRGAPEALPLLGFDEQALLGSGAAGLVSPQRLAPAGGHMELDLREGRVRLVDGAPSRGLTLQPACASPDGVPLYLIDATIDGVEGFFVVDTGSDRTSVLLEGRFADRFDGRRRSGRTVATLGRLGRSDEVPDVEVRVGDHSSRVTIDLVEPAPGRCPSEGTLGSDVLRGCVIRVARDAGRLECGG